MIFIFIFIFIFILFTFNFSAAVSVLGSGLFGASATKKDYCSFGKPAKPLLLDSATTN